ncbi:hypothetical protein OIU34_27940 [Pararhizobium sp. BT-229]|uniref:hypothetical protein n=1 Tax=Pararhizobium sp. BT-229 TaxID=2986923 RepID=UPI0021F6AC08|nr:hypothetical protein [Pararhizobium sp. BT-229]MCV9965706.1 hypothetical protein [Pararhizobium sp. BT-229]
MTAFFLGLWSRVQGWLATAGVALTVILAAFLYGRADGRADAQRTADKANARARTQSKEVENEINGLDDLAVRDRLSGWMRDDRRG